MPAASSSSPPALPRLTPVRVLSVALLAGTGLALVWLIRAERVENAALRSELATLMLAQRASASRESLAADAIRRAARLEDALTLMRREMAAPATPADSGRAAELERVVAFLREEITAAHEIIDRLSHEGTSGKAHRP